MTPLWISLGVIAVAVWVVVCARWFHDRGYKRGRKEGYEAGHAEGVTEGRTLMDNWWLDADSESENAAHELRRERRKRA